ncbi:MAG TPA: hypothetical protein VKB35_07100, partial [Ktedonobacteraceae bacterium]|nr:hypothetical protein [Ktedonobacteraceae bacterium]
RKTLPPSTRARGPRKLRLAKWLCQIFPISVFVVEDIKAKTKPNKRRWNRSFSPLEVGKQWFYEELSKLAPVQTRQGYQTKEVRDQLGLKKTGKKLAEVWEAHCIDAWCLAYSVVGGQKQPDNRRLVCIAPLMWHHRQLHRFEPEKGGSMSGKLSLHDPQTGKRLTQSAKVADCRRIKVLRWKTRLVPLTTAK